MLSSNRTISDHDVLSSTQKWSNPNKMHPGLQGLKQMAKKELVDLAINLRGLSEQQAKLMTKQQLYKFLMPTVGSSSSIHTSVPPTDLLGEKNCGPKQGENRWTKSELVDMAIWHKDVPRSKANKMTILDLCKLLRGQTSSHASSPKSSHPAGSIHMSSKKCGPKKGPVAERWTKAELVKIAMDKNLVTHKSHASKMSLDELCSMIKGSSGSIGASVGSVHASVHSHQSSSRPSQGILGHDKNCGPKKGENRWTKPELVDLAIHHKNITKYKAKKMSVNELCAFLK